MRIKYSKIIFSLLFGLWAILMQAQNPQENFTLTDNQTGTAKQYVARDYVSLQPGFTYTASSGKSFNAKIDAGLLFPPTENTYADEDGNIVSDPTEGAVVGSIPGQFAVSPTGAATYTIPIEVPSGINGMQPNISLVYNSQSGNGIAGWGWNISGLSMISRTPKNYYFDEEKTGIIWDNTSPLALDGQRLIEIQRWTTGDIIDSIEYDTEAKSGNRIVAYDIQDWGPTYFKVYTKAGQTFMYGNPTNTASYYPLKKTTNILSRNFYNLAWALTSILDNNKNSIRYVYKNSESSVLNLYTLYHNNVLDSIIYGENILAGTTLKQVLKFIYKERIVSNVKYIDGKKNYDGLILDSIKVLNGNVSVKEYIMTYSVYDNKDHLSNLTLKNLNNEHLYSSSFQWTTPEYTFSDVAEMTFTQYPSYIEYCINQGYSIRRFDKIFGDINGDGLTDVVVKASYKKEDNIKNYWVVFKKITGSNQYSYVYESAWNGTDNLFILDKDHDGKDEIYKCSYTYQSNNVGQYSDYKIDFFKYSYENSIINASAGFDIGFITKEIYDNRDNISVLPIDFKGCGNIDFVLLDKNNKLYAPFKLTEPNQLIHIAYSSLDIGGDQNAKFLLTDINGNGKTEIMYLTGSTSTFYEYNNTANQFENIYNTDNFDYDDVIHTGDFNGDGNTDLFIQKANTAFTNEIWLSNGANLFQTSWGSDIITTNNTITFYTNIDGRSIGIVEKPTKQILDVNNDGKSDVLSCYFDNSGNSILKLYISTGDGFLESASETESGDVTYLQCSGKFSNINEKGIVSQNFFYEPVFYQLAITSDKFSNKIEKITDPFGNQTNIVYQPLNIPKKTNINIQKSLEENKNNLTGFLSPDYEVVTRVTDPLEINQYSYYNPYIHWSGRGFLGFDSLRIVNTTRSLTIEKVSKLNTDYYLLYPETERSKKSSDGSLISETNVKYIISDIGNKRYVITTDKQTSTDHLTGLTSEIKYLSYDNWLNPISVRTTKGGIVSTQTSNYIQKGAWCPNKPDTITTTTTYDNQSISRKKVYTYDNKGNVTSETNDPDNSAFKTITEYSDYDDFGHPTTIKVKAKDKNGTEQTRTTYQTYTTSGRFMATKTNLLNETTTYSWNETLGILNSETQKDNQNKWNRRTFYTYDNWGKLKETQYPDGNRKTSVLQWAGTNGPSGAVYYNYTQTSGSAPVIAWYDGLGREIQRDTYGLDNDKKISVNTEYYTSGTNKGRIYRVSEPYFEGDSKTWVKTYDSYDAYGRPVYVTTPMGQDTTVYAGLSTTVKTPEGNKTTTLNSSGLTESVTTNGKMVSYTYYPSGLPKTSTPQNGSPITLKYDLQGNRTKIIDPDAGTIRNEYNGFGEMTKEVQLIHAGQDSTVTVNNYDTSTGLITNIVRNGETTAYTYDSDLGHKSRVKSIEIAGQHRQTFSYDAFDRVTNVKEEIIGSGTEYEVFNRGTVYDALGRVKKEIYPSGYYTVNSYDQYGNLVAVTDASNRSIWTAVNENARGQLTGAAKGGRSITYSFDGRGFPTGIQSGSIVDMEYNFNARGNLEYRIDHCTNAQQEDFVYDELNRLTDWTVTRQGTETAFGLVYNAAGNIETRSDLGNYTMSYGENGKPHALTSIGSVPANFPTADLNITYTDFRKIKTISENYTNYTLTYGVDDQRRKSVYTRYWTGANPGSSTFTRYYVGDYEEEIDNSGNIRKIHYLSGGAILIQNGGVDSLLYLYTDYQGSVIALTDESGNILERYAYDPWGKRRDPDNWLNTDTRTSWLINRGYTGHEHLDAFAIINMNGRVYDPLTAQFFSPDPFVQAPDNWLNYNRYGYCYGNPFRYNDPSGNNPLLIAAVVYSLFFTDLGYDVQKYLSPVALHINGGFGNERKFLSIEASFGVPQIFPISYRYNVGAAYYWRDYDNMYTGWETSHGGEWGAGVPGFTATFSTTDYNRKGEEYDQYRDVWSLGNPFFKIQVENDADMNVLNLPWLPKHKASDKYMTSEVRLRLFGFVEIGNTTVTGNPDNYGLNNDIGPYGTYEENDYRGGILYLQIGFIRIGYNSEAIREHTQNWVHDLPFIRTPRFPVDKKKHPDKWYWEFF
ncbi:MAG: SpvB/TcaC N-terminal domain-containing protein [Paludibacter sp.]|nr:SpvB/TcaC N-terminal domain-containing protein [Paludibacter sp.]